MNILNMSLLFPLYNVYHRKSNIDSCKFNCYKFGFNNFSMFLFNFHTQTVKIKYNPYVSICKIII